MDWIYAKGIPIEAQFLYRKGLELEGQGRMDAALACFRQAAFLAPGYAKAIFEMGNCLAKLGRYNEARETYRRAARIDPLLAEGPAVRTGALQRRPALA